VRSVTAIPRGVGHVRNRGTGSPAGHEEIDMLFNRSPLGVLVTAAALVVTVTGAAAFDESKYPD
jgi:hypothetical protein